MDGVNIQATDLIIEPTKHTPRVEFKSNGNFLMEGRCYPTNSDYFFLDLIDWSVKNAPSDIAFKMAFEHIDTRSIKNLLKLIKALSEKQNVSLVVNWEVVDNDEFSAELGSLINDLFNNVKFNILTSN